LGASSTASVCVAFSRPAFAAPYATVLGDGRTPLTLAMLTMLPPSGCLCMTALAFCAHTRAAVRFKAMIPAVNRGDAVAVSAGGEPPALLTSTSSEPKRSTVAAITASTCSASRTSAATNNHPSGSSSGS
jgi:hypothetical protein